jgi:hypothetical protein
MANMGETLSVIEFTELAESILRISARGGSLTTPPSPPTVRPRCRLQNQTHIFYQKFRMSISFRHSSIRCVLAARVHLGRSYVG